MQTFQDLIMKLNSFWAAKGCLIWQPHNQVVGAGTMNPATFLRVLGPEPWSVAYIEPSVRPDDGRFGQNPNRLYTHTQYQVIIKPSPERSQELYLESLQAIGVDLSKHDIRFVEDNWAQPAIGAWGLGWEVWLDGLEITQYTYFQQVGGLSLDPVCLEITYGLERIAMALQGVRNVFDLKWDNTRSYGDVKLQDEIERSEYAFNYADVEELHELFDIYERECKRTLEYGLVAPSHDYVLQCSNLFNLLDTRGAIGVTERARFLGRIRDLARQTATQYVAQREKLGHPWLKEPATSHQPPATSNQPPATNNQPASLLLEIGVEELPADNVPQAQAQLGKHLSEALAAARIEHGAIELFATPRRIAALVANVAPTQRSLDELVKGPSAKIAFDAEGKPTPAGLGFAKRFGVDPSTLFIQEEGNASYAYARKQETGKPTPDVLAKLLPDVISKITFEKTMRWNASNIAFARPINWLVALLGETIISFNYAQVQAGNQSWGVRGLGSPQFEVNTAANYPALLKQQHIVGDIAARKADIQTQVQAAAAHIGGVVALDEDLLDEVTNLVEMPAAVVCTFEPEFLKIPSPVLISVMRKKQRYFTVLNPAGAMLPHFITVRNGASTDTDDVRKGNEDVVRARFADAAYFYRADVQKPLGDYLQRLDTITFQAKLGSILDKVKRMESLVQPLGSQLNLAPADLDIAHKAAHLCKADLATNMVVDMTSLQGTMGREYHKLTNTDADAAQVGDAIFEHYLPRYSGDKTPQTDAGLVVGLADKLDSIAGLFAVGLAPKGSADPFALRRAAIGVVANLVAREKHFSLREGLKSAAARLPEKMSDKALTDAHAFVIERARAMLMEAGVRYDLVDAALSELGDDPFAAHTSAVQLNHAVQKSNWAVVLAAYARCARITKGKGEFSPDLIHKDPEESTQILAKALRSLPAPNNANELVENLAVLEPSITTFFEKVMVMSEDPDQRNARMAVLQQVVAQASGIADLSKVEGF